MLPYQNLEIYVCVTLFVLAKIVRAVTLKYRASMYDKNKALTCIPEKNERENVAKWVPKKKHEVLKAKYKCLKKLLQFYDASITGILPENVETRDESISHKRTRSHRTKSDASAGTENPSDVSFNTDEKSALKDFQYSSTKLTKTIDLKTNKHDKSTQESKDVSTEADNKRESESVQTSGAVAIPYLVFNKRKPLLKTILYRILGMKPEKTIFSGHAYAVSENISKYENRRRRGLRFQRRPRKARSELVMNDVKSPIFLPYVQSVQRNCLMDTCPRQCPVVGCRMTFYGIINYNDHLNLCHFPNRKFVCHYCHEGFSSEYDKTVHENEHIGISNIVTLTSNAGAPGKMASVTQTDLEVNKVPEEKLMKIVSFFDKIADNKHIIDGIEKSRHLDLNLLSQQESSQLNATDIASKSPSSEKTASSTGRKTSGKNSCANSNKTYFPACKVRCRFCGENFDFRRQLSLHVDLEHQIHDKFSKFHSCPGIVDRPGKTAEIYSEDGRINVHTFGPVPSQTYSVAKRKSLDTVNCDPSGNIVFYKSVDSMVKEPSRVSSLVHKIRSYRWEPGTKAIRV